MRTFRNSGHLCPEGTGSQSCRRGAHVSATCCYLLWNGSLIYLGREIASAILKAIPTRNRKAIQCVLVIGDSWFGAIWRKSGPHGLEWKTRDPYSFVNDSLITRTHCSRTAILGQRKSESSREFDFHGLNKKDVLHLKSGVTSDFRCLIGHVVQRGVKMAIASHC